MDALLEAERRYDDEVIGETPIPRTFEDAAERFGARPAQLYKGAVYDRSLVTGAVLEPAPSGEFRTLTYGDMRDLVHHLAAGFVRIGVEPDDRVAMYSHTRMEWAQADYALLTAGAVVTTVYPQSSTGQLEYLLDHPDARGVVAE
ncbi:MAG: AMP-binding protein, partial [Halobacteriota archaeon]